MGWSIGRADAMKADILLDGDTISGIHASLNYLNGKFYLIDNQSRNGSYLLRNNRKKTLVEYTEIIPKDLIVFGASEFSFDDIIAFSLKRQGRSIQSLSIIRENSRLQNNSTLEDISKIDNSKEEKSDVIVSKKTRCMDCMKPIISNLVCPACGSDKHLKGK